MFPQNNQGPQKKILLVEDDDALASVYQLRLEAEGFSVQRVPNGEAALSTALEFRPDLILLDAMMPKVSNRAAKADKPERHNHLPTLHYGFKLQGMS